MSIFNKILALFLLSIFVMILLFIQTNHLNHEKIELIVKQKYLYTSKQLFDLLSTKNISLLEKRWKDFDYEKIDDLTILNKPHEIKYEQNISFGSIQILFFEDQYYLYMHYLDDTLILFDKEQKEFFEQKRIVDYLILCSIVILILLLSVIIKLLSPLKSIGKSIKIFGQGDYSHRMKQINSKDEIADIISNFNFMAENQQNLITSRQIFLNDISHELRTPISKAKISLEMINPSKYKTIVKSSIEQIDQLTNELLELEKLNSKNIKFNFKPYQIDTVLAHAFSKMIDEDENFDVKIIDNFQCVVDLNYMAVAIKNLLDNGLKYKTGGLVSIIVDTSSVTIETNGEKLQKDINYYFETFTQEDNSRKSQGYGLGLNIVKRILDFHKAILHYQYINGKNSFTIKF